MKYGFSWLAVILGLALAACAPAEPATPTLNPAVAALLAQTNTPVPTANPLATTTPTVRPSATPTPTLTPTQTPTPTSTFTPTLTFTPSLTPTLTITPSPVPSDTATPIPSATPGSSDENEPTWTPPPDDGPDVQDHYRLRRPISDSGVNYFARTYAYGNTAGGRYQVHHGVDFENPGGTPVLAAGDGTVFYAGDDLGTMFGPQTNYYGNVIVIQHGFNAPTGGPVFTLYGHLARIEVQTGQSVTSGQQIGAVGAEGVALGPHLHFEVRVGDPYDFGATRNPDLWIFPYRGFGTLAGLVRNEAGGKLYDVTLTVEPATGQGYARYAFSYASDTVNSSGSIGENFSLGDLPANYYDVSVRANGRSLYREIIYVAANQTTFIEVVLPN